ARPRTGLLQAWASAGCAHRHRALPAAASAGARRGLAARAAGGPERGRREAALTADRAHGALLERHHLEIVLGHAAIRAGPGIRDVLPARARGDAFFGNAGGLVVDESADHAHPGAVRDRVGDFAHPGDDNRPHG